MMKGGGKSLTSGGEAFTNAHGRGRTRQTTENNRSNRMDTAPRVQNPIGTNLDDSTINRLLQLLMLGNMN